MQIVVSSEWGDFIIMREIQPKFIPRVNHVDTILTVSLKTYWRSARGILVQY